MITGDLLCLDRIVRMEPDAGATALRNVPNTLAIFDTHFPRKPVVPGVLIIGSLGRLAAELLERRTGSGWVLAGVERVRFRHFVQPGDQMELDIAVQDVSAETAVFKATVSVDGRPVTTVARLRMRPAETSGADA